MPDIDLSRYEDMSPTLKVFTSVENYIYLYHLNQFIYLPVYPDKVTDSTGVSFSHQTPLTRTAPIYSYSNSGPRTVQFSWSFHREMFNQIDYSNSQIAKLANVGEDYADTAIRLIQSCVYPTYNEQTKQINPPMVAVKVGEDIFVKGIVNSNISVAYNIPILRNDKYALIDLSLQIDEIEPYDAGLVATMGSYRGLDSYLAGLLSK